MTAPDETGSYIGRRISNWWNRQSKLEKVVIVLFVVAAVWFAWHTYSRDNTQQHERDLGAEVKTSMQHSLDADSSFAKYHLAVTDVTLIQADGNRYDGMATVHGNKGIDHKVLVHVTDGDNGTMWQTETGAFIWVIGES